jgi:DNA-binding winged helix-turn-helix (wHTH) protein
VFELDPKAGELRKKGMKIRLQGQPVEILVMLLERPGATVTREELQEKLWPADTFVDFEQGLNNAMKRLRAALDDDAESPHFIETLPRRGYRFIAPVESSTGIGELQVEAPNDSVPKQPSKRPWTLGLAILLGGSILVAVLVLAWLFRTPLPSPKIVRTVQLTSDSLDKLGVATDGSRVYFSEYRNGHWIVAAVSVSGGEVVPIRISFPDAHLINISPDKSELLVTESRFKESPLWLVPVLGGAPRRLGNILAHSGSWSPDGKKFAYTNGGDLYLAKADGSESQRVLPQNLDRSVWAWLPTWSPDGTRLRFERYNMEEHTSTLLETTDAADSLHAVFSGPGVQPGQCCSAWTPDGKYYLFTAWNDLVSQGFAPAANTGRFAKNPPSLTEQAIRPYS